MINFAKYVNININPDTGISEKLDKSHFSSKGGNDKYMKIKPTSSIIDSKFNNDIMSLVAYGLSKSSIITVIGVVYPELRDINRGSFDSYITRNCIYYAYNNKELNKLKSVYKQVAEDLLVKYEELKDKPSSKCINDSSIQIYTYTNKLPELQDIKNILYTILNIGNIAIPELPTNKELDKQKQQIIQDLNNCNNIEVGDRLISKLRAVLCDQKFIESHKHNRSIYNAIKGLNECGVISSIYRWMEVYNK